MDKDLLHGFYLKNLLVEPRKGTVTGRERSTHLPPKAMEVLLALAAKPDRLVTRETLITKVWGLGQGSDEALGRAISEIRHALGDSAHEPSFIQTVPRRGYRLIVQPTPTAEGTRKTEAAPPSTGGAEASLFDSLRQRGVFEAAIAYLVSGWLIIQVADIVFDQLHLPAWSGTFVTVLVIAGFPIVILLSWFLEFRGGRAVLDDTADRRGPRQFSRTYLSVIGALAIAAGAVYIYDSRIGLPQPARPEPVASPEPARPPIHDNSIAVLPFLNLDGGEETQIFANGLVDDVITRLSRVPGLLVSSRGDAFTLEPNSASHKVRERLRVARYLEGSVQMEGERMRIIVQMIDSETGFHVLSRSFDRLRDDFFDVRDEITQLTVANVRVALPPETRATADIPGKDPSLDVYVLYRRGVEASLLPRKQETLQKALGWYDRALKQDAEYAAAHAGKCRAYVELYPTTDDPSYIERAEESCGRALQLNPNLDVVHAALGDLYRATGKYEQAAAAFLEALAINDKSVASLTGLGKINMLQNEPGLAEERLRQAVGLHPGDWSAYNALGYFLYKSGRYAEAAEQYAIVVALDDRNFAGFTNLGTANMMAGNFKAAAAAFSKAIGIEPVKDAYSNLGLMYYYLGETNKSIDAHNQAIRLEPNDRLAWSNLGDALRVAGHEHEAREAFATAERLTRDALSVNPNDPNTQMDLAWITANLGRTEEAEELIARARNLAPHDPYIHYYEGLIFVRKGEASAALDRFEEALDEGYSAQMLAADPQLLALRGEPRFEQAVQRGNSR